MRLIVGVILGIALSRAVRLYGPPLIFHVLTRDSR